jgi:protein O-mannosyl-transferase
MSRPRHRSRARPGDRSTAIRSTGAGKSSTPPVGRLALGGALLAVLATTFAIYTTSFDHEFTAWDDPDYVTENVLVLNRDYGGLSKAIVSSNYHPLTMFSLAWNAAPPLSPRPFLATNALLHTINTGLVFWLAFLLSRRRIFVAFWTALLFGIHPMHVESVAWISERKDVLYTLFFLAAAIAYRRYQERREVAWLGVSLALFVLSCLSKGMAVVFPLVMVLMDVWERRRLLDPRAVLEKAPFFLVALVFGRIALDVQGGGDLNGLLVKTTLHLKGLADTLPYSTWERLVLPTYGFAAYLVKLFVPVRMSAFYPYPPPGSLDPAHLAAPLVFLGVLALIVWDLRRTRILSFGLGWFVLTILPVLQWIPVGEAIMADRYTYLSYVGPLWALSRGLAHLAGTARARRTMGSAVLAAFAIVCALLTVRQIAVWRNSETLWTNVIRLHPTAEMAYVARGNARGRAGRVEEALGDLRTARRLGSDRYDLYDGLGNAYGATGQLDSSVVMYGAALAANPNSGRTYYNRAVALVRLNRPEEALQDLERAGTLLAGTEVELHLTRADAYLQLQRFREAAAEYDRAIERGARGAMVYNNRGIARWNLGDQAGAEADIAEARRLGGGAP